MRRTLVLGLALLATPLAAQSYRVGVVSESGDIVTWLRPEGATLVVDHVVPVGVMPADIDGPHNITVSADQRWYYVSIAHGTPVRHALAVRREQRHPGRPGAAGVLPHHRVGHARRRVRLRRQFRLSRRPSAGEFGLRGVHARHDDHHRHPRLRHAARRQGESRGDGGLDLLHAQRRTPPDRRGDVRHRAARPRPARAWSCLRRLPEGTRA